MQRHGDISARSLCDVVVVDNDDIFRRKSMAEIMRQMSSTHKKHNLTIDDSLDLAPTFIAIRDPTTAKEIVKWITFGNFLHKTSVLSSLATFVGPRLVPARFNDAVVILFGLTAIVSAVFYNSSWMFDPCSQYQVEKRAEILSVLKLPKDKTKTQNSNGVYSVVLVRREDYYRRLLHNFTMFCTTTKLCYMFSDILGAIFTEVSLLVQQQLA